MKNDNGNIPKTEKELEEWMKANCANFNSYSINGNVIYEGFGIEIIGETFIWYYTERGQKDTIKTFTSEQDIIEHAYIQIQAEIVSQKVCKFRIDYFCNAIFKNE